MLLACQAAPLLAHDVKALPSPLEASPVPLGVSAQAPVFLEASLEASPVPLEASLGASPAPPRQNHKSTAAVAVVVGVVLVWAQVGPLMAWLPS